MAALLAGVALGLGLVLTQLHGSKLLSVQSGSMVPAFHKGDLVIVNPVPAGKLATGDVITFVSPHNNKQTITHRIIRLPSEATGGWLMTQGDANPAADTPISPQAVVGKVGHRVPFVGLAMDFVRKPVGLALAIYIPALVIIGQELRRLARHYKKMQPYRVPGRVPPVRALTGRQRLVFTAKATVFCIGVGALFAIPARAALLSTATLTANSINALGRPAEHILLRRVTFECSLDNTVQVNKLPEIIMYNPGSQDVNTGGWYLQSREGRLVTFRPGTMFDARDDYDIEPDLQAGVHYDGDFLALFDSSGHLVDAISWGEDTTYLNPALSGVQDGSQFRRFGLVFDTDTAVDWTVSVSPCTADD